MTHFQQIKKKEPLGQIIDCNETDIKGYPNLKKIDKDTLYIMIGFLNYIQRCFHFRLFHFSPIPVWPFHFHRFEFSIFHFRRFYFCRFPFSPIYLKKLIFKI